MSLEISMIGETRSCIIVSKRLSSVSSTASTRSTRMASVFDLRARYQPDCSVDWPEVKRTRTPSMVEDSKSEKAFLMCARSFVKCYL